VLFKRERGKVKARKQNVAENHPGAAG